MRKLTLLAGVAGLAILAVPGTAHADGTTPADITWTVANSVATGDQDNAALAATRTGYTAVVWEDDRDSTSPGDPVHSEVFLRLYKDRAPLWEKKLSAGGTGSWRHVQPDVALREDGTAVVVWAEDPDGNGVYNITVRTVSAAGTVTGSATANASSAGQQLNPAVAADPDGSGFAVVWEDKQTATAPTVRVAGFSTVTTKTYEAQVHASGGTHQRPDVAMGAAGNAIVAWDEDGDGNAFFNIGLKILTPGGGVKLAQGVANSNGGGQQRHPSAAANANGDFVVAWETDHTGTPQNAARSFTAAGTARSADVLLPGSDPQAGIDDQGYAVVSWTAASDVHAQGLNPDGTVTGRLLVLRLNATATGRQDEPALAVSPWGEIVSAFTDDQDSNGFDQVYLGTGLVNTVW
ncbi:hypothetical protein [Longispora albida]|uniref:hypothetical protein n=1 Tax=Longispora albida TaxID=203523 RepID=UPI00036F4A28|nr:hypothetical protein [Longispora albida]